MKFGNFIEHIIAIGMAVAFFHKAHTYHKTKNKWALLLFTFAFISLYFGVSNIVLFDSSSELLLCWVVGLSFFILSVYLFGEKDKFSYGIIVFIIAAFFCFCGFSSVQTFLKQGMFWKVTSALESYGEKLGNFQTTVENMNKDSLEQQSKLKSNQITLSLLVTNIQTNTLQHEIELRSSILNVQHEQTQITNKYQQITMLQSNLDIAESNLSAQTIKLSDVEYWVKNIIDKTVTETYKVEDVNNFFVMPSSNNTVRYIVRLKHAPVKNSVEESVTGFVPNGIVYETRIFPDIFNLNVGYGVISGSSNMSPILQFHYVIDDRKTNLWRRMPQLPKEIQIYSDTVWGLNAPSD